MKTEFTEVSETRKHLSFEIPSDIVEAEIGRVTKGYSKQAKIPGFRPGKVPAHVVRQRFKDQILYDVAHDLIPKLVGDALKERGLEPVATPDIRDVVIEEGKPLTFVADFETLPPIDPGEYTGVSLRRPPAVLDVGAADTALEHLQQRAARWHPVEDRPAAIGDTLLIDMTRTRRTRLVELASGPTPPSDDEKPESLPNISIELGAKANPPGFDDHLVGTSPDTAREFTVNYPADYEIEELAGAKVDYQVTVKGIRTKELLPLNDDFAKEVSDVERMRLPARNWANKLGPWTTASIAWNASAAGIGRAATAINFSSWMAFAGIRLTRRQMTSSSSSDRSAILGSSRTCCAISQTKNGQPSDSCAILRA
jgi:trigger factor